MKPFLSDKCTLDSKTSLNHEDNVISVDQELAKYLIISLKMH